MPLNTDWPDCTSPVEPTGDEAHVWAVPLVMRKSAADEMARALTPEEHQRASEFRFDDPRRRFVIARGALRRLLGGYLGIRPADVTIELDANQKPRLAGTLATTALQFNV